MVANNGGLASLLNVILCRKEHSPITAVLALGYIGAMSPILASAVIHSKVHNFNAIGILFDFIGHRRDIYSH